MISADVKARNKRNGSCTLQFLKEVPSKLLEIKCNTDVYFPLNFDYFIQLDIVEYFLKRQNLLNVI